MELWAHINGNTYPIALGASITDALGEELDSMSIRIPHVEDFSLKPYDDVYITDTPEYPTRLYNELFVPGDGNNATFYRHFLISNYQRQEINNEGFERKRWFNFTISLISETKFLEKILMPNRTITNPLNATGKSVFWMTNHFVDRYTPKIKLSFIENEWEYFNKIRVSSTLERSRYDSYLKERMISTVEEEFKNVECQECSFNNPTLREVLTRIFQTRNFIPVVLDGVIFCRSLDYKGNHIDEITGKTWDTQTMNGDEYVDRLRKNYSQGLTGDNGCVYHEYVGFRNITSPTMTYGNLAIEVKNPIYKINKFYVCYYSKWKHNAVVKCDMTSFVIPNSTRAFLSNDIYAFQQKKPTTINGYYKDGNPNEYVFGMCDYRFNTVGYDIGSKRITGWGEQQSYTSDGVTYSRKTIIENILNFCINNAQSYSGTSDVIFEGGTSNLSLKSYHPDEEFFTVYNTEDIVAPDISENNWNELVREVSTIWGDDADKTLGENTLKMKTIFFEIEYQGMISSAVTISKDAHDGDIMAIDNQHESLALTENDGLVSQAKANRLGNKSCVVMARVGYNQPLINVGDYDEDHGICYKRTISLEMDFIAVTYYFCQDYVLMNYFTSVNSKYKSSAYASFEQSVNRDETNDVQLLLSKSERYNKSDISEFSFTANIGDVISLFSNKDDVNGSIAYYSLLAPKQGLVKFNEYDSDDLEYQYFATDRATYMSGTSMCMTSSMVDSETAGTFIRQLYPDVSSVTIDVLNVQKNDPSLSYYELYSNVDSPVKDVTGTLQDYLSLPTKRYDGSLSNMHFGFQYSSSNEMDEYYQANRTDNTEQDVVDLYLSNGENNTKLGLVYQPKISKDLIASNNEESTVFGRDESYKDAKEVISETFQIEPISQNKKDILITPYFLKLSNLFNTKIQRVVSLKRIDGDVFFAMTDQITDFEVSGNRRRVHSLGLFSAVEDYDFSNLRSIVGVNLSNMTFEFDLPTALFAEFNGNHPKVTLTIHKIVRISSENDYADVLVTVRTNKIQSNNLGWNEVREYEKSNFIIRMWNEDSFTSEQLKQKMNDPSENYGFYPQYGTNSAYGTDWNYYDDIFCVDMKNDDNQWYHNRNAHFQRTPFRKCFSFNFDSFPNGTTCFIYDVSGQLTETKTFNSEFYDPEIPVESFGSEELTQPMSLSYYSHYDLYTHGFDPEQYSGLNGPRQADLRKITEYQGTIRPQNVFWMYSEEMPTNIRKTYPTEEDLLDDGYHPLAEAENFHSAISNQLKTITFYGAIPIGSMTNSQIRSKYAEMRYVNCFFKDDNGGYHLVASVKKDEQDWPDYVDFTSEQIVVKASFYVSFLYDRSKTVYDAGTMRPDYEIDNVAGMVSDTPTCHHK